MPDTELNPRQAAFVREFLVDRNATQAAIRAGYAGGQAAEVTGSRLLSHAKVAAALAAIDKKANETASRKLGITKQYLADKLMEIAEHPKAPINVRRQTLMDLGKLLGHIVERREHRVINGVTDLTDEELTAVEMDMMRRIKGAH